MICFVFNIAPHYRVPIYRQMGNELSCDIYVGDKLRFPIKKAESFSIPAQKGTLKNIFMGPFYWQRGTLRLLFCKYDWYVTTGDVYCLSTWALFLLSKLTHKKVCTWSHGLYGKETKFQYLVKKVYYLLQDKMLVYNERSIELLKEAGIPKDKILCIANSLDSDRNKKIRESIHETEIYKRHFVNDYPTVIYCGRLQRIKELDILINAVAILRKKGIDINLVIVGKDDEGLGLEKLVYELNLNDITWFYGPCYDECVLAELYFNAAVCVSPGNVGLTAIHSLSFGCPVITHSDFAYQMPEFEAIEEGVTGSYFKRGSANSLANAISSWISVSHENRQRTRQLAFQAIDKKWNVHYQVEVLRKAFV